MIIIAKLTPQYVYRKDGSRAIASYKTVFQKTEIENTCKFNKDTEIEIEYKKDKIIITKKEN